MKAARTSPRPPLDLAVYPAEERVGEESLQRFICELLRPLVERWLAERGVVAFTGADQFVYYRRGDATKRVAPDVYVIPGARPGARVRSWKTWEEPGAPSFALEVVSGEWEKDYVESPDRYREAGARELVVFDPDAGTDGERVRFQVFRRGRRGFTKVVATDADRVESQVLGCRIVAVGAGDAVRLRLGGGPRGDDLFPTADELLAREREARQAAEAEVARLRSELRRRG